MPKIPVDGRNQPSVSADIFGKRDASGTEVTLIITRNGSVQMSEHMLMVEYAAECLTDNRMNLHEYADQVLAPHPMDENGLYVPVDWTFDHDGTHSTLVLFQKPQPLRPSAGNGTPGGRLYEWAL